MIKLRLIFKHFPLEVRVSAQTPAPLGVSPACDQIGDPFAYFKLKCCSVLDLLFCSFGFERHPPFLSECFWMTRLFKTGATEEAPGKPGLLNSYLEIESSRCLFFSNVEELTPALLPCFPQTVICDFSDHIYLSIYIDGDICALCSISRLHDLFCFLCWTVDSRTCTIRHSILLYKQDSVLRHTSFRRLLYRSV